MQVLTTAEPEGWPATLALEAETAWDSQLLVALNSYLPNNSQLHNGDHRLTVQVDQLAPKVEPETAPAPESTGLAQKKWLDQS